MIGVEHGFLEALVGGLQAFAGLAWLILVADFSDTIGRFRRGRRRADDWARLVVLFVGLLQIGFTLRWLMLGRDDLSAMERIDLEVWSLLYFGSGIAAAGLVPAWRLIEGALTSRASTLFDPVATLALDHPLEEIAAHLPGRGWIIAGLWLLIAMASVSVSWLGA